MKKKVKTLEQLREDLKKAEQDEARLQEQFVMTRGIKMYLASEIQKLEGGE